MTLGHNVPLEASMRSSSFHWSFDEWVVAMKINAMPLVEIPINVNHVLILSNPLPSYPGAHLLLAKLIVGWLRCLFQVGGSSWARVWAIK
jgi:hypothetical protein